jgi:ABC-2 type transport system ATP-binding protein
VIEVNNLTKKYGTHTAVDHLSFSVEEGQIYGFLGPNGAGKSTTMNIMTGYLAATEGTVLINGIDIQKNGEKAKKNIGYLPEIPPLYADMTVEEFLKFAADLKKVPQNLRRQQIADVMEMTFIVDQKSRLIKNLSKGYRQRVGLAQAILGDPAVIILDEPMVGLDPRQIIEIRDLIHRLKEKHTVILSSHILSEVSAICDHVLIMSQGRLVAGGSPDELSGQQKSRTKLTLMVKGEFDLVRETLLSLPAVETIEQQDKFIQITSRNGLDIREEVFYQLANAHLPILHMQYAVQSLEEIFLELTKDAASDNPCAESENEPENGLQQSANENRGGAQDDSNL